MKKIIILGGGAIGSLFAALLSGKHEVKLIGRKRHVETINKKGLKLTGIIHKTVRIDAVTYIDYIQNSTIILLTTKAQDSKQAIAGIRNKLKKDTMIVCLQNGFGSDDIVRRMVHCKVLRAVTKMSAEFIEPGKVNFTGNFVTYIGQDGEIIADIFNSVGIKTEIIDNIEYELWKKLVYNCVINGLASILNVRNNQLNNRFLNEIKKAIVQECIAVAEKINIKLDPNILDKVNDFISVSTNLNSTLQDLYNHKKTEIEYINGAVVKLGKKYNVPTPVNKTILAIVQFLEKNC